MRHLNLIFLIICLSLTCCSCKKAHGDTKEKFIQYHWENPDICTNEYLFVTAEICEYCGTEKVTSHTIDTLRYNQKNIFSANPKTDQVKIKLGIKDSRLENPVLIPLWVKKIYKFESDTLTINFTKDDYEISPFEPK